MLRLKYTYKDYYYSPRATKYHHFASLVLTYTAPAGAILTIAAIVLALCGEIDDMFYEILVGAIASIVYAILYFTVIDRKIEAIALEDYKKWISNHNK